MKKTIAIITAAALLCGAFASCGKKKDKNVPGAADTNSGSSEAVINIPAKPIEGTEMPTVDVSGVEFEDSRAAGSGDAFLAIVDRDWKAQYLGSNDDSSKSPLSYNAGIAQITGNGDYTVSVTTDTKGFRFKMTGDPDQQYTPEGLKFLYVNIKDGEKKFPNAVITVNWVKVNGEEIPMNAKPYTSSEDGNDTRATIYNEYVIDPPTDARCTEGKLYNAEGKPEDFAAQYGAMAVNGDNFSTWSTVEVNFTVSGI